MFLGTSPLLLSLLPLAPGCRRRPGMVRSSRPRSPEQRLSLPLSGQAAPALCGDKRSAFDLQLSGGGAWDAVPPPLRIAGKI